MSTVGHVRASRGVAPHVTTTTTAPTTTAPATTSDATTAGAGAPGSAAGVDLDDPRTMIEASVLLANGRLAGRRFASRAEAEAWARPEDGEQVVEFNLVCECAV